jgi:NarL family two-component system response regulator LiaR
MIKVAIVEDNLHFQQALTNLLNSSGLFKLWGVYRSAEEALGGLPANQPDIAIVDIKLLGMSGISLIKKVRQITPSTQYMICTLYQDNEYIFDALKAGASGYILKDASGEEIKTAIKDLYMGGSPMSPYIARKIINLYRHKEPQHANSFGLSEREIEVLQLMSSGLLYKEIADKLLISSNTVKNHLKSIYRKLHVQNKIEAVNKFMAK